MHTLINWLALKNAQIDAVEARGADVLVTAGAGSGKTRTLVARYMTLLQEKLLPRQVVAITFTEKAAREMRNRIRAAIHDWRTGPCPPAERERWDEVEADVDTARIGTIHSLCASLLRAHPAEAMIDPMATVLEEGLSAVLRAQAVDDALVWAIGQAELKSLFEVFSIAELRDILTTLLANRLDARDALGYAVPERWASAITQAIASFVHDADVAASIAAMRALRDNGRLDADAGDKLAPQIRGLLSQWEILEPALATLTHQPSTLGPQPSTLNTLALAAAQTLHRARKDYGATRAGRRTSVALAELKALRARYASDIEPWLGKPSDPPDPEVERRAAEVMAPLGKLFDKAADDYRLARELRQALDFDDLEDGAVRLLENAQVRARWQGQITALLVDEFQDTNERQRRIVESLAGIPEGKKGRLFVVGDAKQSIYRFRGADVAVFRDLERAVRRRGGRALSLDVTFRTHKPLIEALNELLGAAMGDGRDGKSPRESFADSRLPTGEHNDNEIVEQSPILAGRPDAEAAAPRPTSNQVPFSPLRAHRSEPDPGIAAPYVEFLYGLGDSAEVSRPIAATMLARRLIELRDREGVRWEDVALLFRAAAGFPTYEATFEEAGIPFVTIAGKGFYDRPEVRDLLNILAALADPWDDLAMAGLLRSPAFGLSDAALYQLRWPSDDNQPPWLSDDNQPPSPSNDNQSRRPTDNNQPPSPSDDNQPPWPSNDNQSPWPSGDNQPPSPSDNNQPPSPSNDNQSRRPSNDNQPPSPSDDNQPPSPSDDNQPPSPSDHVARGLVPRPCPGGGQAPALRGESHSTSGGQVLSTLSGSDGTPSEEALQGDSYRVGSEHQGQPADANGIDPSSFWLALRGDLARLSEPDRQKATRARAILDHLTGLVDRVTVAELIEELIDKTYYRAILGAASPGLRLQRNVDKLLADASASGLVRVSEFLEYVASLREGGAREGEALAEAGGAVRLMSVHKAKGLEFPVVVIADATRTRPAARGPALLSRDFGLVPHAARFARKPLAYNLARAHDDAQSEAEDRRVLYVAATRAREKLLICGHQSARQATSWFATLAAAAGLNLAELAARPGEPQIIVLPGSGQKIAAVSQVTRVDNTDLRGSSTPTGPEVSGYAQPLVVLDGKSTHGSGFTTKSPILPQERPPADENCHSERSEESWHSKDENLRSAQGDMYPQPGGGGRAEDRPYRIRCITGRRHADGTIVGTLVHEAIRRWRFPGDPSLDRLLRTAALSHGLVAAADISEHVRQATSLLARLRADARWPQLDAAERWHEVPYYIVRPGQPPSGAIDLLYRTGEPHSTTWRIVDFKTDYVVDESELAILVKKYTHQVLRYRHAVSRLLGGPVQTTLCFLDVRDGVRWVE